MVPKRGWVAMRRPPPHQGPLVCGEDDGGTQPREDQGRGFGMEEGQHPPQVRARAQALATHHSSPSLSARSKGRHPPAHQPEPGEAVVEGVSSSHHVVTVLDDTGRHLGCPVIHLPHQVQPLPAGQRSAWAQAEHPAQGCPQLKRVCRTFPPWFLESADHEQGACSATHIHHTLLLTPVTAAGCQGRMGLGPASVGGPGFRHGALGASERRASCDRTRGTGHF